MNFQRSLKQDVLTRCCWIWMEETIIWSMKKRISRTGCFGTVQADIVNASMNSLQRSTILLVSVVVFCIAALLISFIIQKGRTNLRKKDTEILYRDELFQKLSMNVDDVFLMLDAKQYQADYIAQMRKNCLVLR